MSTLGGGLFGIPGGVPLHLVLHNGDPPTNPGGTPSGLEYDLQVFGNGCYTGN
jgi:hypothetical protein